MGSAAIWATWEIHSQTKDILDLRIAKLEEEENFKF